MSILPVAWAYDHVRLIDQTRLPTEFAYVEIRRAMDMVTAIQTMIVRGAPAIGVAAAFGMALAAQEIDTEERQEFLDYLETVANALRQTRPTAINLFWAIDQMLNAARQTVGPVSFLKEKMVATAQALAVDEYQTCVAIGEKGLACLPPEPQRLTPDDLLQRWCFGDRWVWYGLGRDTVCPPCPPLATSLCLRNPSPLARCPSHRLGMRPRRDSRHLNYRQHGWILSVQRADPRRDCRCGSHCCQRRHSQQNRHL
jgi:translation initiation factor 2B subunit (eIF-2B alpha/beta/delta family)